MAELPQPEALAAYRGAFERRVKAWAGGRGLCALLRSLTADFPHSFALPAAALAGQPKPWEPADETEGGITRAYKKATLHLHPDRMKTSGRELSVRVEAEEVLKALTEAHAAGKERWLDGIDSPVSHRAAEEPSSTRRASTQPTAPVPSRTPSQPRTGGSDLRNEIFGDSGGDKSTQAQGGGGRGEGEQNPFDESNPSPPGRTASAADDIFRSFPSADPPARNPFSAKGGSDFSHGNDDVPTTSGSSSQPKGTNGDCNPFGSGRAPKSAGSFNPFN